MPKVSKRILVFVTDVHLRQAWIRDRKNLSNKNAHNVKLLSVYCNCYGRIMIMIMIVIYVIYCIVL